VVERSEICDLQCWLDEINAASVSVSAVDSMVEYRASGVVVSRRMSVLAATQSAIQLANKATNEETHE
jgi:hypothetical protein